MSSNWTKEANMWYHVNGRKKQTCDVKQLDERSKHVMSSNWTKEANMWYHVPVRKIWYHIIVQIITNYSKKALVPFRRAQETNKLFTALITSYPSKGRSENIKEKEQQHQKGYEITQGGVRHACRAVSLFAGDPLWFIIIIQPCPPPVLLD